MRDFTTAIGLDVHARSTTAVAMNALTGEQISRRFSGANPWAEIASWALRFDRSCKAVYESGCRGFHPARELAEHGLPCVIAATSHLAKSPDDKKNKNDKNDAAMLASNLLLGKVREVFIPDKEHEDARVLAQLRASISDEIKHARQRLSAMLMMSGNIWDERTATGKLKKTWGKEHMAWISRLELSADQAFIREQYLRCIADGQMRLSDIDARMREIAQRKTFKPYVDALQALNGCGFNLAFASVAHFDRFSRYSAGRKVTKGIGLCPGEDSSGEHIEHLPITKAGNGLLRRLSVEGAWCIARATNDAKKPPSDAQVSDAVLRHAKKGNHRMRTRRRKLLYASRRKGQANVANVASAAELMRWIWAIGCMVEQEQADKAA